MDRPNPRPKRLTTTIIIGVHRFSDPKHLSRGQARTSNSTGALTLIGAPEPRDYG
jgi:hypothetical protein